MRIYYNMTDLINKSIEELIEFCKEKGINYLTKAKKPMAKKTIINNLKKKGLIIDIDDDDDLDTETTDINVIIRKTHNYLYKSAGIVGSKAQNDIMRVLIMRIFNILLSKNNSYLLSVLEDDNISDKFNRIDIDEIENYKTYVYDISNLLKVPEKEIKNVWLNFIGEFMSILFDNIYTPEDAHFHTPNDYDITRLIKIMSKFIITDEFIHEFFIKNGDIHESFLKYQGNVNSKELGQFFTPKIIIKSLLNECGFKDLILNKEGSNFSLCDLCIGTGGLLCYTYNYCKNKINASKIYGCEIEKDTIKFGSASLMLSTNQYNSNIIRCNSLIENPYLFNKEEDKFDIIFINPPFGSKNNYKSLNKLFNDYKNKIITRPEFIGNSEIEFKNIYPIVSNTGTELFIQLVIYSLKKDGIACIILPDGELMTSNNMTIRKYILDNCQILKIISINGGAFTNTGVKTKALIIKKCNNDNYNQDIEFIELNEEVKVLGIRKLNEKLQFTFEDKKEEIINYNSEIEIKTLGEVCEFLPKSKHPASFGKKTGLYPFFKSSLNIDSYIDEPDYSQESIIIGDGGSANINYSVKFSTSDHCYIIQNKNKNIINFKYIYYYLKINIHLLEDGFNGVAIKNISKQYINLIKIPISLIEIQNKIVEYLDMIYETVIKNNNEKIENIKKLNKNYLDLNLQFNKDIEIKTLGEVSEFLSGKRRNANDAITNGKYKFITCSIQGFSYLNEYDFEDKALIINSINGSGKCMIYYAENYSTTINNIHFKINIQEILTEYIYYYLKLNIHLLENGFIGSNQKKISKEYLSNVKIPIPSIEKQKEIIKYLEFNDELIKTLEKENEINKNNAELLMKQILYK
jgi:type I restriction-modification system DNA methylase subunit